MRILMVTWEYPPRVVGGIARVVNELSKRLAALGHEVHVITWLESDSNQFEMDHGVFVHRVHSYNINALNFIDRVMHLNFALIEKGAELVQKTGKFDIIHAHDWLAMYAAKTLKHAYHIPLVSTIHATEYGRNHGIHEPMQKYINDAEWLLTYESWKIICNSEYMKNEISHIFSSDPSKIAMVPNGIDIHKFDGIERDIGFRRNYASDNEKIVLFAGRLVQEKGIHILVEAIPKILHYYKNAKIVIAGKGPKYDDLVEYTKVLGVSNHVYFTGHLKDIQLYKLYKCADVAVFPSLYEPFGLVALEAMLAEIPVVVADTGGLGEIVEHNENGLKSYLGNANSLADSILEILYNSDNKVEKMVKKAKEKVIKYYSWDRIAELTEQVYKEVYDEYINDEWRIISDNVGEKKIKKLAEKSKTEDKEDKKATNKVKTINKTAPKKTVTAKKTTQSKKK